MERETQITSMEDMSEVFDMGIKGVCPRCREVIDLDEVLISDEGLDDEFELADLDNEEVKLDKLYEKYRSKDTDLE